MAHWGERSTRPSRRLDKHKTANIFGKQTFSTPFSKMYSQGAVPLRLDHGAVKCRLKWEVNPEELDFNEFLVLFAEGIRETKHPYVFVARQAFKEILECPEAGQKARPVIGKLIVPFRKALMSKDTSVFLAGLEAVQQLSNVVGAALNEHLSILVVQINKKSFNPKFKTVVSELLSTLHENGGDEVSRYY